MYISVKNLSFAYTDGNSSLPVLKNITFEVKEGEFVAIVGPSGCGKTTLLHCICGLLKPTQGKISIKGKEVSKPNGKIGMVFQDPLLFPWRTVVKNITYGLELKKINKIEIEKKVKDVLQLLKLYGFENYYPYQLSGGMKQRVNLGRALVCDPEILLLDEPFAHLDAQTRKLMQEELLKIVKKTGKTFILVTHQIEEAVFLADRVIVLTKRPGIIKKLFNINKNSSTKINVLKNRIWDLIRNEIQI